MRKKAAKEKKEEVSEEEIVEEMEVEESSEIEIPKVQEAASISAPEFSITKIESFEEFENIDVTPFQPESIDVAQASTSFAKKEQAPKGHKRSCCIRGCQTVYRVGTQFFHFPTDQEILLQWLDVIAPEQNDDWEPNSESFVCEYHFREDCYLPYDANLDKRGRQRKIRTLKPDAVPSIFGNLIGGALDDEEQDKLDKIRYGVKPAPKKWASKQACCMAGCKSVYRGPGLFFFRFPAETSELNRWMKTTVGLKQPNNWMPSKEDWICMYHFKDDSFMAPEENVDHRQRVRIRPRLKPDALPTIFANSKDETVDLEDHVKLYKIRNGDKDIKYRCVDPRCGATTKNMIQLFPFPNYEYSNRLKWIRKIRNIRHDRKWTPEICDRVCMAHFANECFALGTEYYDTQGNQRFRLRIRPNSVPSIFGRDAMTRVIVVPEDEPADPEIVAKISTHDHNYAPGPIENEPPPFKKKRVDDANVDDMSWMGGKSKLTSYGADPFFIPELDLNEKDDKLTVFLKQKIVHQQKVIQELKQENRRARIVMNMIFNDTQMKKLGFDSQDPKNV